MVGLEGTPSCPPAGGCVPRASSMASDTARDGQPSSGQQCTASGPRISPSSPLYPCKAIPPHTITVNHCLHPSSLAEPWPGSWLRWLHHFPSGLLQRPFAGAGGPAVPRGGPGVHLGRLWGRSHVWVRALCTGLPLPTAAERFQQWPWSSSRQLGSTYLRGCQ